MWNKIYLPTIFRFIGYDLGTLDGIWHSYIPASLSWTYLITKTHSSVSRLCRDINLSSVVYVYSPTVKICTSLCRIHVTWRNKVIKYSQLLLDRYNGYFMKYVLNGYPIEILKCVKENCYWGTSPRSRLSPTYYELSKIGCNLWRHAFNWNDHHVCYGVICHVI